MFDIAWTELLVVAVLLIIVVGPKDLPNVLRTIGRYVRKARAMAREFQSGIEDLAREADVQDLKKQVTGNLPLNPKDAIKKTIDPDGFMDRPLGPPSMETAPDPKPDPKPDHSGPKKDG